MQEFTDLPGNSSPFPSPFNHEIPKYGSLPKFSWNGSPRQANVLWSLVCSSDIPVDALHQTKISRVVTNGWFWKRWWKASSTSSSSSSTSSCRNPLQHHHSLKLVVDHQQEPETCWSESSARFHYCQLQVSHEKKKPLTFHYTGWLIGILIMVYYNPYITGSIIPYITLNN